MEKLLTLKQYDRITRNLIYQLFPKTFRRIMNDEELMGELTRVVIDADSARENKKNANLFRKQRIKWTIKGLIDRLKKDRSQILMSNKDVKGKIPCNLIDLKDLFDSPRLSKREQQCLHWKFIENWTGKDIANKWKVTPQYVSKIYKQALKKIHLYYVN